MKHIFLGLSLAALLGAASVASCEMTDVVDIPITIPETAEAVVLEVHIGPLPGKAQVRVLTEDGILVGSLGTFGVIGMAPAGFPHLVVPQQPDLTGDLRLTGEIVLDGVARPATPDEVRSIRVLTH